MRTSEKLDALAPALVEAQKELKNPKKTAKNPFFNSMYTTLDQIVDETKPILTKHGLSLIQSCGNSGEHGTVSTMLLHTSGQYIENEFVFENPIEVTEKTDSKGKMVKTKGIDPQAVGRAVTYLRRYQQSAMLNIASEDDNDGNNAPTKKTPGKDYGSKNYRNYSETNQSTQKPKKENQQVYEACLAMLNEEHRGYRVFKSADLVSQKKACDMIVGKLDSLMDHHEVLKKISSENKALIDAQLKEGDNANS